MTAISIYFFRIMNNLKSDPEADTLHAGISELIRIKRKAEWAGSSDRYGASTERLCITSTFGFF